METKQRIGNEVTDRARVQVTFCSRFSFTRSPCSFLAPRFNNIQLLLVGNFLAPQHLCVSYLTLLAAVSLLNKLVRNRACFIDETLLASLKFYLAQLFAITSIYN